MHIGGFNRAAGQEHANRHGQAELAKAAMKIKFLSFSPRYIAQRYN
jgi:hypothetical protein